MAEHIAQTCESLAGPNRPKPFLTSSRSVFRDDTTNAAILKFIYLPRRTVQHIFSVGQNMYATAYREMVFDMNDTLVETFLGDPEVQRGAA